MSNSESNITNNVVAVTNQNPTSQHFGTAFVIYRTQTTTYLLTCKHVLDDVGVEGLQVGYQPASVVAVDEHFDLALLRCEGQLDAPTLRLKRLTDSQANLRGAGYSSLGKHSLAIQTYELVIQSRVELESKQRQCRSHGWRLQASAELVAGCSGAPALDAQGFVVGIISHKLSNEQAFAVSIEALLKIWPDAPTDLLPSMSQSTPIHRAYQPRDAEFLMNCEKELDLFTQIAAVEETGIRLINVYGEGGMGKSRLLREFQAIANDHALHCLHFSLGVTATVEELLDTVVAHYDTLHFPDYEQLRFNRPESPTREKEQNWLSNLTRAFVRDLTNHVSNQASNHRLALFFDQYEKSNEIFRWWMEHTFLVLLPVRPLTVIVAGREPIERKPAWKGYHSVHLNGVAEEWYYKYAQHRGVDIEGHQVKFAFSLLKGRPKDWVEFVGAQTPQPQLAGGLV